MNNLLIKIYSEKLVSNIQSKINKAGLSNKIDAYDYLNCKFIFLLILFFVILLNNDYGYILSPIISLLYILFIDYLILGIKINNRSKKLDYEALYFFEVLTLTLESGRNLEKSLWVTVDNIDSELSCEFRKTLEEVKYGKSLMEALVDMKKRIPSETINNIILNITQTSMFGSGILETLYNQVDFLRDKQLLDVKEQINKIPNKISIISVIFIVPIILVLILGPFIINYIG